MKSIKAFLFSVAFVSTFSSIVAEKDSKTFIQQGVDAFYSAGDYIGNIQVPLLDKFIDDSRVKCFLPCALVGYAFNEYPKQTIALLAGLLTYTLYTNDKVRGVLRAYDIIDEEDEDDDYDRGEAYSTRKKAQVKFDADLFVYEADDAGKEK